MSPAIYRKLQEHLDQYSAGYPATESGIEMNILERLFTEKEAEIFLQLSFLPESSVSIATRLDNDPAHKGVKSTFDCCSHKSTIPVFSCLLVK